MVTVSVGADLTLGSRPPRCCVHAACSQLEGHVSVHPLSPGFLRRLCLVDAVSLPGKQFMIIYVFQVVSLPVVIKFPILYSLSFFKILIVL